MLLLRLFPLILCFSGLVHAEHRVFTRKDGFLSMRDKLNVYFFRSDTHRLLVRDEGSVKTPRHGSLDKAMRKSPCVAGVNGGNAPGPGHSGRQTAFSAGYGILRRFRSRL